MLRNVDSYEQQQLALSSAASLIRRKAAFGKELSDHASDLVSQLAGLHDKFDMDDFQEMRLQALIALVVSLPATVGPLLAKLLFEGDYSIGQRVGLLTTLGMGGRELAGYKDDDLPFSEPSLKGKSSEEMFPSKRLPSRAELIWSTSKDKKETAQLERITGGLEKLLIQPMAADAADKATGPNVLKVRTFSSRIAVEKQRARPKVNALGKVVGEGFFFPLTGRLWAAFKD
jgi:telomere length regulation protein